MRALRAELAGHARQPRGTGQCSSWSSRDQRMGTSMHHPTFRSMIKSHVKPVKRKGQGDGGLPSETEARRWSPASLFPAPPVPRREPVPDFKDGVVDRVRVQGCRKQSDNRNQGIDSFCFVRLAVLSLAWGLDPCGSEELLTFQAIPYRRAPSGVHTDVLTEPIIEGRT